MGSLNERHQHVPNYADDVNDSTIKTTDVCTTWTDNMVSSRNILRHRVALRLEAVLLPVYF